MAKTSCPNKELKAPLNKILLRAPPRVELALGAVIEISQTFLDLVLTVVSRF